MTPNNNKKSHESSNCCLFCRGGGGKRHEVKYLSDLSVISIVNIEITFSKLQNNYFYATKLIAISKKYTKTKCSEDWFITRNIPLRFTLTYIIYYISLDTCHRGLYLELCNFYYSPWFFGALWWESGRTRRSKFGCQACILGSKRLEVKTKRIFLFIVSLTILFNDCDLLEVLNDYNPFIFWYFWIVSFGF